MSIVETTKRFTAGLVIVFVALAGGRAGAETVAAGDLVQRRVMAFYYPWYGTPDGPVGAARVFDGVHTYNTAGSIGKMTPAEVGQWAPRTYESWVALADRAGKISTLTVIPGYDDTKIRKPGLAVKRYDGEHGEALLYDLFDYLAGRLRK